MLDYTRSAIAGLSLVLKIAIFALAVFVVFRHKDGAVMKSYLERCYCRISPFYYVKHFC